MPRNFGAFLIKNNSTDKSRLVPIITTITMSDAIKHECGIALLRLKKPLELKNLKEKIYITNNLNIVHTARYRIDIQLFVFVD